MSRHPAQQPLSPIPAAGRVHVRAAHLQMPCAAIAVAASAGGSRTALGMPQVGKAQLSLAAHGSGCGILLLPGAAEAGLPGAGLGLASWFC